MSKTPTQKLTFAAVATALASVLIILTNFLPLRVSLLMLGALCFYLVFDKAGVFYGLLAIGASLLISFFTKPFSSAFFLTVIVFAPYSILCYFIKNLHYTKPKTLFIRIAVMLAFSSLAFFGVFAVVKWLAVVMGGVLIDFEVLETISTYSYIGVTLIFSLIFIIFDFSFNQLSIRLAKLIRT